MDLSILLILLVDVVFDLRIYHIWHIDVFDKWFLLYVFAIYYAPYGYVVSKKNYNNYHVIGDYVWQVIVK